MNVHFDKKKFINRTNQCSVVTIEQVNSIFELNFLMFLSLLITKFLLRILLATLSEDKSI